MESVRVIFSLAICCAISVNHGSSQHTTRSMERTTQSTTHQQTEHEVFENNTTTNFGYRSTAVSTPSENQTQHRITHNRTTGESERDRDYENATKVGRDADKTTRTDGATASIGGTDDATGIDAEGEHDVDNLSTKNTDSHTRNDIHVAAQEGFPWWSLLIIIAVTVAVVIALSALFYRYNRRLNENRDAVVKDKRASELIVDTWIAASLSSTGSDVEGDDELVFQPLEIVCDKMPKT